MKIDKLNSKGCFFPSSERKKIKELKKQHFYFTAWQEKMLSILFHLRFKEDLLTRGSCAFSQLQCLAW